MYTTKIAAKIVLSCFLLLVFANTVEAQQGSVLDTKTTPWRADGVADAPRSSGTLSERSETISSQTFLPKSSDTEKAEILQDFEPIVPGNPIINRMPIPIADRTEALMLVGDFLDGKNKDWQRLQETFQDSVSPKQIATYNSVSTFLEKTTEAGLNSINSTTASSAETALEGLGQLALGLYRGRPDQAALGAAKTIGGAVTAVSGTALSGTMETTQTALATTRKMVNAYYEGATPLEILTEGVDVLVDNGKTLLSDGLPGKIGKVIENKAPRVAEIVGDVKDKAQKIADTKVVDLVENMVGGAVKKVIGKVDDTLGVTEKLQGVLKGKNATEIVGNAVVDFLKNQTGKLLDKVSGGDDGKATTVGSLLGNLAKKVWDGLTNKKSGSTTGTTGTGSDKNSSGGTAGIGTGKDSSGGTTGTGTGKDSSGGTAGIGTGSHFISQEGSSTEIFDAPFGKAVEYLSYGTPVSVEPRSDNKWAKITVAYGLLKGKTGWTLYNKTTKLAFGTVKEDPVPERPQSVGEGLIVTTTGVWKEDPRTGAKMDTNFRIEKGTKVEVLSNYFSDDKRPAMKYVKIGFTQKDKNVYGWVQVHKILAPGPGTDKGTNKNTDNDTKKEKDEDVSKDKDAEKEKEKDKDASKEKDKDADKEKEQEKDLIFTLRETAVPSNFACDPTNKVSLKIQRNGKEAIDFDLQWSKDDTDSTYRWTIQDENGKPSTSWGVNEDESNIGTSTGTFSSSGTAVKCSLNSKETTSKDGATKEPSPTKFKVFAWKDVNGDGKHDADEPSRSLDFSVEDQDMVPAVVILIHGVRATGNPDRRDASYSYDFFDLFAERFLTKTRIIRFDWGIDGPWDASGKVGTRMNQLEGISDEGWGAVAKLKEVIVRTRELIGPKGKISIVAHSQGTIISLAALQEGAKVDNWILLGSPLSQTNVRDASGDTHIARAARNVSTRILNFSSTGDAIVTARQLGSGVGNAGLPEQISDLDAKGNGRWSSSSGSTVQNIMFKNVGHSGANGWWEMKWLADESRNWSPNESWPNDFSAEDLIRLLEGGSTGIDDEWRPIQDLAFQRRDIMPWISFGSSENIDDVSFEFTLTKGLVTGFHFDDKDLMRYKLEISSQTGKIRYRVMVGTYSTWRENQSQGEEPLTKENGLVKGTFTVPDATDDATVWLRLEGVDDGFVKVRCRVRGVDGAPYEWMGDRERDFEKNNPKKRWDNDKWSDGMR